MVHFTYLIELVLMQLLSLILIVTCILYGCAYRLTPSHRYHPTKFRLFRISLYACLMNIVRSIDPSCVFGALTLPVQHFLGIQVSATLVIVCAILLVESSHSMYIILSKPMPKYIKHFFYGTSGIYYFVSTVRGITEMIIMTRDPMLHLQGYTRLWLLHALTWTIMSIIMIASLWYVLYGLKVQIEHYSSTLCEKERRQTIMVMNMQAEMIGAAATNGNILVSIMGMDGTDPFGPKPPLLASNKIHPMRIEVIPAQNPHAVKINTLETNANNTPLSQSNSLLAPVPTLAHFSPGASQLILTSPLPASSSRLSQLRATSRQLTKLNLLANLTFTIGVINDVWTYIVADGKDFESYESDSQKRIDSALILYSVGLTLGIAIVLWYCTIDLTPIVYAWRKGELMKTILDGAREGSEETEDESKCGGPCFVDPHHAVIPTFQHAAAAAAAMMFNGADPFSSGSDAPMDSAASLAPTGLSLKSGFASRPAKRMEGDRFNADTVDIESQASRMEQTQLSLYDDEDQPGAFNPLSPSHGAAPAHPFEIASLAESA